MIIQYKINKILFLFALALLFGNIGAYLNQKVINANSCRMPVLTDSYFQTKEHFSISSLDQANHSWLGDIFGSKKVMLFSLGDIFLYLAIFVLLIIIYLSLKQLWLFRRKGVIIE